MGGPELGILGWAPTRGLSLSVAGCRPWATPHAPRTAQDCRRRRRHHAGTALRGLVPCVDDRGAFQRETVAVVLRSVRPRLRNTRLRSDPRPLRNTRPDSHPRPLRNTRTSRRLRRIRNTRPSSHPRLLRNTGATSHRRPTRRPRRIRNTRLKGHPRRLRNTRLSRRIRSTRPVIIRALHHFARRASAAAARPAAGVDEGADLRLEAPGDTAADPAHGQGQHDHGDNGDQPQVLHRRLSPVSWRHPPRHTFRGSGFLAPEYLGVGPGQVKHPAIPVGERSRPCSRAQTVNFTRLERDQCTYGSRPNVRAQGPSSGPPGPSGGPKERRAAGR